MRAARAVAIGCGMVLAAIVFGFIGSGGFDCHSAQAAAGPTMQPGLVSLRIQFGMGDQENTAWDGSLSVSPGRVAKMEIWRKGPNDNVEGSSWKIGTRPAPRFLGSAQKGATVPVAENGVIVTLDGTSEQSEVVVKTKQGEFSFKLADVPLGKRLMRLEGNADVLRIPVSYQLTADATEEDYPSAAVAPDGSVYVAYVAFTHGKNFAKRMTFGDDEPRDLSNLNEPTGGDRVFVMRLSGGQWSAPMPVTKGGDDIYKTAIVVDGRGRPWVFWSMQKEGNFDLYACTIGSGTGSVPVTFAAPMRLTRDPGPDINPAAATDAQGRVWVAWQGFRGNHSNIFAMKQQGDTFSPEMAVSAGPGNDWDPTIATSKQGDVAIAWDTYANGNYDVYLRVAKGGEQFAAPLPVAASANQEVHASATYDGTGRLWVAWEQGPEQWGKDFGATVKDKGNPLYGGGLRTVALRCFEGEQAYKPQGDLAAALQSTPMAQGLSKGGAKAGKGGGKGKAAAKAGPGRTAGEERNVRGQNPLSLPRLTTDAAGRVWLAYRARSPHYWCNVGTAWFEYVTCYQGDQWLSPVYVHNSDNTLDNRPALVAAADGQVLLIGSCDGRQKVSGYPKAFQDQVPPGDKADPINNDLFVSVCGLPSAQAAAPTLAKAAAEEPVPPTWGPERAAVERCRSYRLEYDGKGLRLMRGEFHRHTELSTDGQGDGGLIDMYRYALDAASMDWIGCGDHDNNNGREYPWWITQKTADTYKVGTSFMPMYCYERSVSYPDGHRNVVWAKRGVRTLPRFGKPGTGKDEQQPAHTPDTQLLYRYLAQFNGVCASHTSATNMGTDWRDNDPKVEPVVEIFQGCRQNYEEPGAPRAPTADDAIGGWRPNGFVWLALKKGYRLGFQASSDHTSTHISFCSVWAEEPTREAILQALKQRHVYGATDHIIADVHCGKQMMGDEFTSSSAPSLKVKLIGTAPFKQVDIVKDNAYVYQAKPGKQEVDFTWTDMSPKPGTSYYYVRGEQEDGELVWVSPMWINYTGARD